MFDRILWIVILVAVVAVVIFAVPAQIRFIAGVLLAVDLLNYLHTRLFGSEFPRVTL